MNAMWLTATGADFDIVGEACLDEQVSQGYSCPCALTDPHCSMQGSSNLVVLLYPRTASKNFGQPELADGVLHVSNLSLRWLRCLDPLGGLPPNTAYHVCVSECFGCTLAIARLRELRWQWLSDT